MAIFGRTTAILAVVVAAAAASPWPSLAQAIAPTPGASSRSAAPEGPAIPGISDGKDAAGIGGSSEPLSDKLDRSGGVIHPPSDVDPALSQSPPAAGPRSMPVIPPPGTPGGQPGITAK